MDTETMQACFQQHDAPQSIEGKQKMITKLKRQREACTDQVTVMEYNGETDETNETKFESSL